MTNFFLSSTVAIVVAISTFVGIMPEDKNTADNQLSQTEQTELYKEVMDDCMCVK